MILALAGRRIDDPKEKVISFPMKNIDSVRAKLKALFVFLKPSVLVCSGSCGADLLALEVAGEIRKSRRTGNSLFYAAIQVPFSGGQTRRLGSAIRQAL